MSRQSIFECFTSMMTINNQQLSLLVDYLMRHQDMIMDKNEQDALFKIKPLVTSPIAKLFTQIVDTNKSSMFSLLKIPSREKTFPEVVTMRHVPFDMEQILNLIPSLEPALKLYPNLYEKDVINVSPLLKMNGTFSDLGGFQNTVVRDYLSRSYFSDSKATWLSPTLSQFVSKVYSMSLASSIAQWYNLDFKTQSTITAIFAHYFLTLITNAEISEKILKMRARFFTIPNETDLEQIFSLIEETYGKREFSDLSQALSLIESLGTERVKLNLSIMISKFRTLGPDTFTSSLSLEYPPYFIYLMLLSLSGSKIGLSYRMKQFGFTKEGNNFITDLFHSPNLFPDR